MAGLRLESIINETLAGTNKKLTEMSGAVLETIIDDNLKDTLIGSALELAANGTLGAGSSVMAAATDVGAADMLAAPAAAQTPAQLSSISIEMSQSERLFWVLIFSVMVLVAAGGNTIVVYIVATNREMKSVTNYFLVNLSLADTMVSTLNVIFNFISMLNSHWPFGKVYCKISNFIAILSISASVFTLTAISCDRYNAIIHPLRPRMSHRHAVGWILLIWTLSSALALPNFIYSTDLEDRLTNDNVAVTCTMLWPDGRYPTSSYDHIYNIVILVVTYLVPILTMAILYYRVGKELWGYEAIGENIDKQQRAIMAKKKIVKMMIVVVIIFALCWLPYHAFFVVNYYLPLLFQDSPLNYQRCFLFMYWLAMSNSMYNPIIIYFMNSKFRLEFKKILHLICCCSHYKPVLRPSNTMSAAAAAGGGNHHQHMHHQQQRASTTNYLQQTSNDNNNTSDNLNGRRQTTTSVYSHSNNSKQLKPEAVKNLALGLKLPPKETANMNSQVTIAINSITVEGNHSQSVQGERNNDDDGDIDDGDEDHGEHEPFISRDEQIVNNVESSRTKDLNLVNCRRGTADKLIDFSIKNNTNNIDKCSSTNNKDSDKVWI